MVYLDYLRMLGDLFINYTAQSVYVLDHEHRFEVVELNRVWNQIDPMLALNVLKKKDVVSNSTSASTSASKPGFKSTNRSDSKADSKQTYGQLPLCWQWNQPEGCKYEKCRYIHKCSVEGCGAFHPAFKHHFRSQPTSKQV